MRFLLVEDNEIAANAVAWAIGEHGHEVRIVHTAREVLGLIRHDDPDVIILDVTLPDLDGVTLSRLIRRDHPSLPIIFATGHVQSTELAAALSQRRTAILHKPYSIDILLITAGRLMQDGFSGAP